MLDPMDCLRDGVPLSLVMDLLSEAGPDAARIYAAEQADDTDWTLPLDEWKRQHLPAGSAAA